MTFEDWKDTVVRDLVESTYERVTGHDLMRTGEHRSTCTALAIRTPVLEYVMCDDWLIYARCPHTGLLYYIVTECWEEWLDQETGSDGENNAIEKFMLPVAWLRGYFHSTDAWELVTMRDPLRCGNSSRSRQFPFTEGPAGTASKVENHAGNLHHTPATTDIATGEQSEMKKSPDGHEVYFGYTLVKPRYPGDSWKVLNSKGNRRQPKRGTLDTRADAREFVKSILDEENAEADGSGVHQRELINHIEHVDEQSDEPESHAVGIPGAWTFIETFDPSWRMQQDYADILANNIQSADEIVYFRPVPQGPIERIEGYVFYPVTIRRILPDYPTAYKHYLRFENGTAIVEYYNVEKHLGVTSDDVIERALSSVPAVPDAPKRSWKGNKRSETTMVYFYLHGGVAIGEKIGKPDSNGHQDVRVTKAQRSPSCIDKIIMVEHEQFMTDAQVDAYYAEVRAARKMKAKRPQIGNQSRAYNVR